MAEKKTSLEVIAPTVEEAIARGAAELGISEDDLQVEVLDEGGKGFLGISARQARVRLTVAIPGGAPAPQEEAAAEDEAPVLARGDDDPEAVRAAHDTVAELVQRLGLEVQVSAKWGQRDPEARIRPLLVDVHGDDLGILIGRRGETLTALQYIARLIVAKELERPVAVVIDIEGYRARREQQLRRLARKMATQAADLDRTMELEPMPPNERRIIHVALRENPAVTTESVGEGSSRKVTIIPRG
ncbi:MAG: RNA-binding cell elongation regulator Jag/EloR [Anaerolineales bacterium]